MSKFPYLVLGVLFCAACSPFPERKTANYLTNFKALDMASDPEPIKTIPPMYPLNLARNEVIGYTCFLFDIPLTGIPKNIRIYDSVPLGAFDQVALQAFEGWRFKVHEADGIVAEAKDKKYCLDFKLQQL